mmetsp:Transcript_16264/g.24503  ORF Transcript_16264/g.24503 Transcript_16264/m.24503 type:complete len:222 (+) Transcript_16264:98-763(+)
MNFFGIKKVDPIDQAKEWKRHLARECRKLDRDIAALERAEKKAMKECKDYAKKGELRAARTLAKEIANTRKACDRIRLAKVKINSVSMALQQSIAMIKVGGCIQKSMGVMQSMNEMVKLPELRDTMTTLAREMARAGIIEETLDDSFATMEPEDLDDAADAEVDRVIEEITAGVLEPAGNAPSTNVVVDSKPSTADVEETAVPDAIDDEELQNMRSRIQAL